MRKIYLILFSLFAISGFAQVPANDLCTNAQAIVLVNGQACINSTNKNATSDGSNNAAGTCDTGVPGNEVWYTFVATDANNVITVTPNGATPATALVITLITTGCGSGVYSQCNAATGSNSVSVTDGLTPGEQVLFSVESNGTDGTFQVCISSTPPPNVPGEGCAQATNVCSKSSIDFPDMTGFTASGVKPTCFGAAVKKDVWIKFTVGVSGTLEFLGSPVGGSTEFDWAVYDITSTCASGTSGSLVACDYDYTGNTTSFGLTSAVTADNQSSDVQPPINVTAGNTYAILIDNFKAGNNVGFGLDWGGTFQMGTSALFTVTPQSACSVPVTATITNGSVGATTYTWNYGDGSATTNVANPPAHTYTASGDYLVSLVVNGGGCTSVYSQRVNLNAGPVITVNPLTSTICPSGTVNLVSSISLGTAYNDHVYTNNANTAIPNNTAAGLTTTITSSGMLNNTLGAGSVQSICFTINHSLHADIGDANANDVTIKVNGNTYNFTPLPLPFVSGTATYCFPQSVLNAIMAAGGNANTSWIFKIADTYGNPFGGTGSLISWNVVLRDMNSISGYTWSPSATLANPTTYSPTASPAATTVYTLTATDKFGCTNAKTTTVTVSPTPTVVVASATICATKSTTLTASGATSYTWSPATGLSTTTESIVTANPSSTQVYTIVGSSGSCTTSTTATVTVLSNPTVTVNSATICAGSSATLTANGATSYTWSPSATLSSPNGSVVTANPPTGTTTYTIVGATGTCTNSTTTSVLVNANPTVTVNSPSICAGTSTILTASGATNYTWTPSATLSSANGSTVSANPSTTTIYTITGANGTCTGTATSTLTVNPNPTVTVNSATVCAGVSATLTATGATNYTWSPSATLSSSNGSVVTASPASTTTYTIVGATGSCTNTTTAVVTIASALSITANSASVCPGGSAVLTANGATTYTWAPAGSLSSANGTTVSASPASTTVYTITGMTGGCSGTGTTTVNVVSNPTVTVGNATVCAGTSAVLTAAGATTYTWAPSASLSSANGTTVIANPATTTIYTITGAVGACTSSTTASVLVNSNPTITVNSATICAGGTATLIANGAANYTWSPSATLSSSTGSVVMASPASNTTYTVLGATAGCTNTATSVVTISSALSVTANNATICAGTSTVLTAAGATNYTWTPSASLSSGNGTTVTASPGSTTTYSIIGESGGCFGTTTTTVSVVSNPTVSVNSAAICPAGTATLLATGATNYTWTPSATLSSANGSSVTASPASTINYTVTGATGSCTNSAVATVIVNSNPTITVNSGTICAGASTSLSVTGATNYTWAPSATLSSANGSTVNASPLSTTIYTITGETASCIGTVTTSVLVNPSPTLGVTSGTICNGASAVLTATGAVNYTWTPAATLSSSNGSTVTANPTTTTIYTITGEAANCTSTTTSTLTVNPLPTITAGPNSTICPGISTTLTANGGVGYTWSPSGSLSSSTGTVVVASPIANTVYTVTGVSLAGCFSTGTVSVDMGGSLTVNVSPGATVCPNSSSTFTASGATNYTWTPNIFLNNNNTSSVTSTPTITTTYTVDGATGVCTGSNVVTIVVQNTVVVTATASNPTICPMGSSTLTAGGAANYAWSPAGTLNSPIGTTVIATPPITQTYTVIGSTGTCTNSAQVVVTVTTTPVVTVASSPTICSGTSAPLSASGASTYTWAPGATLTSTNTANTTASPLTSQIYTVTGASALGCTNFTTVIVTVIQTPTVGASASSSVICIGDNTTLTGTGASSYTWSPAATVNSPNAAVTLAHPINTTTYTVIGANGTGPVCSSSKTIEIVVNPKTQPVPFPTNPMCFGKSTVVAATGGTSYTWTPSTNMQTPNDSVSVVEPLATTVYTVTATKNGMCPGTATVQVIVHPLPIVNAGVDTTINIDETYLLHGTGTGAAELGFVPTNGTPLDCNFCSDYLVNPQTNTCYLLKGVSGFGCESYDEVCITVTTDYGVYIPNAFTPNDDLINEVFMPVGYGIIEFKMWVYDRWGGLVFKSDADHPGWDGKNKGVTCEEGIYVYLVEYKTMGGIRGKKTGHISVIPRVK